TVRKNPTKPATSLVKTLGVTVCQPSGLNLSIHCLWDSSHTPCRVAAAQASCVVALGPPERSAFAPLFRTKRSHRGATQGCAAGLRKLISGVLVGAPLLSTSRFPP